MSQARAIEGRAPGSGAPCAGRPVDPPAAPARGIWAEAWARAVRRPRVVLALCWLALVALCAVAAPFAASGHPLLMWGRDETGALGKVSSPLLRFLSARDAILGGGVPLAIAWIACGRGERPRRLGACAYGAVLAALIAAAAAILRGVMERPSSTVPEWAAWLKGRAGVSLWLPLGLGALVAALGLLVPAIQSRSRRALVCGAACAIAIGAVMGTWVRPFENFDYLGREQAGTIVARYTLVPWSPSQGDAGLVRLPPGASLGAAKGLAPEDPTAARRFALGTDAFGQDVLSQLLHACRLSISIGLVSTGIAVLIGVTLGALMGYFGGWVDLVLFRVVEVFMSVPLLFLLIVAAAVLPNELRTTYTMMAIIGCFTWTGAARFTRAEFLKLREQDFVLSARAAGLPLWSILFRHMLPNGVTPVLVDASFAIAAAITIEATLSFLGLGPIDQASWGRLLASAVGSEGQFRWWLAVFPGGAIFLTVLSYNLIGEALRDAIDPKLRTARV